MKRLLKWQHDAAGRQAVTRDETLEAMAGCVPHSQRHHPRRALHHALLSCGCRCPI
jgi:hypothetical protein